MPKIGKKKYKYPKMGSGKKRSKKVYKK